MSDIFRRRSERELESESRRSPGARLRWLRMRADKTLGDLARFLDCDVSEVSSIERGVSVCEDTEWVNPPDPPEEEPSPGSPRARMKEASAMTSRLMAACPGGHADVEYNEDYITISENSGDERRVVIYQLFNREIAVTGDPPRTLNLGIDPVLAILEAFGDGYIKESWSTPVTESEGEP